MPVADKKHGVVLVVDDEPLIRLDAADMLTDAGWTAMEAADAAEALEVLVAHPEIDVLFTDINMPGEMDGLELARRVHQLRPDVHLLITSGKLRLRADDMPHGGRFLGKPYRAHQLLAQLIDATGA